MMIYIALIIMVILLTTAISIPVTISLRDPEKWLAAELLKIEPLSTDELAGTLARQMRLRIERHPELQYLLVEG